MKIAGVKVKRVSAKVLRPFLKLMRDKVIPKIEQDRRKRARQDGRLLAIGARDG